MAESFSIPRLAQYTFLSASRAQVVMSSKRSRKCVYQPSTKHPANSSEPAASFASRHAARTSRPMASRNGSATMASRS